MWCAHPRDDTFEELVFGLPQNNSSAALLGNQLAVNVKAKGIHMEVRFFPSWLDSLRRDK